MHRSIIPGRLLCSPIAARPGWARYSTRGPWIPLRWVSSTWWREEATVPESARSRHSRTFSEGAGPTLGVSVTYNAAKIYTIRGPDRITLVGSCQHCGPQLWYKDRRLPVHHIEPLSILRRSFT
jgi:hypothetical protein